MSFKLAFDKNLGLEFFVFRHMYYDKSKKIFISSYKTKHIIDALGSFLIMFLNTDFEDNEDCRSFVFWFCFEFLYYRKHPKIKKKNQESSTHLKLSFSEFNNELDEIVKEYKDEFLYLKYTILKNLRLPYNSNFFKQYDDEAGFSQEDVQDMIQEDKLLDKYRKRYMSLASSVSHYGTEKAIERFEKYKKDGVIMKKKYLNKDITPKEFEKWIESTKK